MRKHDSLFDSANRRQRFSIRKLSIGAVSVLLGTTLYLGINNSTAQASTAQSEQDVNVKNGGVTKTANSDEAVASSDTQKANSAQQQANDNVNQQSLSVDQIKDSSTSREQLKTNLVQDSSISNKKDVTESVNSNPEVSKKVSINEDIDQSTLVASKVANKQVKVATKSADTTAKSTTLTPSSSSVKAGNSISFDFKTNEAKAGDTYKIIIPEVSEDLDASGTYKVTAGNFQGNEAATTTAYDSVNKQWVITDTFSKSATSDQTITLTTGTNFDTTKLHNTGTFLQKVLLRKNGKQIKEVDFNEEVDQDTKIKWENEDADDSLYTMDGNQVKNTEVLPNTDYQWKLSATVAPNFNHGTTITIPVPEDFVLDEDATKTNSQILDGYKASYSQTGNSVTITLPQLSDDEIAALGSNGGTTTIYPVIVGKFEMDQPAGNTVLTASDNPSITEKVNNINDVKSSKENTPIKVTIIGKDHGLSSLNLGDIVSATIAPDTYEYKADGTYDLSKGITAIDNTTTHALNKNISISNNSAYDLKDVTVTINIPDGMNIVRIPIILSEKGTYTATLSDGSTLTGVTPGSQIGTPAGKYVKSLKLVLDELKPYESTKGFSLDGTLAKNYSNGNPVEVGNALSTTMIITASNAKGERKQVSNQTIVGTEPEKPAVHVNDFEADGKQTDEQATTVHSGYIQATASDSLQENEPVTYYVVLPTNAVIQNDQDITNNLKDSNISYIKANGRNIVKITGTYDRVANNPGKNLVWQINLSNSSIITKDNLNSDYRVYVVLPDTEKNGYGPKVTSDQLSEVENNTNGYYIGTGKWNIVTALTTHATTLAQGNSNQELSSKGLSDDKKSDQMTFSSVIVNSNDQDLNNVRIISNIPSTSDGKSKFNLTLSGKDGIKVVNNATSAEVTDGVKKYYSTERVTASDTDDNLKNKFVTADEITDWSKVQSVLTTIDSIAPNTVYRVDITGRDTNLTNDVGKTAYASSTAWADQLKEYAIKPGDDDSASVTVQGKSTVNFKLHYKDDNNQDHYIEVPEEAQTYTDTKDTMKLTDFISATQNSDFDAAYLNKDYSKIPEAIMDAIPAGYVLDIEDGPSIENSDAEYPDSRTNGLAQFGKKVQYDYDGDSVVFNLVKATDTKINFVLKRDLQYVNDKDQTIKKEISQATTPVAVDIVYNPLTGKILSNNLDDVLSADNGTLSGIPTIQSNIGSYLYSHNLDTQELYVVSDLQLNNQNNLIKNEISLIKSELNGLTGTDIKDNSGFKIDLLNPNSVQKTSDSTIELYINLTAKYLPSQANLIVLGQSLGQANELLSNSQTTIDNEGNISSNIDFDKTDADLAKDGYTYKIYYLPDGLSIVTNIDGTDQIHEITQDILENNIDLVTTYDTLTAALADDPNYDDQIDGSLNDISPNNATQNFIVVYSPVQENSQNLYILSDNDPYSANTVTKPFALPKTTEEADESGTDYFKATGKTGDSLISSTPDGLAYNQFSSSNTYSNSVDSNHVPHVSSADGTLMSLPVYERAGYYIKQATYTYTDQNGNKHTVTVSNKLTGTPDTYMYSSDPYTTGDTQLLSILDKLTTNYSDAKDSSWIQTDSYENTYQISVTGDSDIKSAVQDGYSGVIIPNDQSWTFDDTKYDPQVTKSDPSPQIINLTYAPLPVATDVQIHYIDVDTVPAMTNDEISQYEQDNQVKLNPSTSDYVYSVNGNDGTELFLDSDNKLSTEYNPIDYTISSANGTYDNTVHDDLMLKALHDNGYVVVQRDKQTRGEQTYDPFSSDASNGSADGNQAAYIAGISAKNYYVYVKKAHPVNYQVLAEDGNGNVETTPIVSQTELGIGVTDEDIATAPLSDTDASQGTISDKYQSIIDNLSDNYTVVPHDSTDPKLKKTDTLDGLKFNADNTPLVTIYVLHRKGDVNVHYIDVDGSNKTEYSPKDGTEIPDTEQSKSGQNYGSNYDFTPWNYEANNYELAQSLPSLTGTISQPKTDIYVYLKHKKETQSDQIAKAHEVIHYVYSDGSKAADDYDSPEDLTYTRTDTLDKVTGKHSYSTWMLSNGKFEEHKSPIIAGYTADPSTITEPTVDTDKLAADKTLTIPFTVTYKADSQKAKLRFYDDTDQKFIEATPDLNVDGDSKSAITFDIPANYDFSNYDFVQVENNGQKLDGDKLSDVDFGDFDTDDNADQVFVAHFKHGTEKQSDQIAKAHEVIHYVYSDGSEAADNYDSPEDLTYTRTDTLDKVTGNYSYGKWTLSSGKFEEHKSPTVAGYTPDKTSISAPNVDVKNLVVGKTITIPFTVTYKADIQKAKLRFYDDTDQKYIEAAPDLLTSGGSETAINFDIPSSYNFSNYDFVQVESNGHKLDGDDLSDVDYGEFDTDKNVNQVFVAHFTHGTERQADQTAKAHEVIHYVYSDGSKAADDYDSPKDLTYTRTDTLDKVTNQHSYGTWTLSSGSFEDHESPTIAGYTPDQASISAPSVDINKLVAGKTLPVEYTVKYTADNQKAKLQFYDDTEQKYIEAAPDLSTDGDSESAISFDIPSSYDFSNYDFVQVENNGQKLEGDKLYDVKYGKFDTDDNADQIFVAHFVHGKDTQTQTAKAQETIKYRFKDGTEAHTEYKSPELTYTRTDTLDKVSGKHSYGKWNLKNGQFEDKKSPTIDGYTPDKNELKAPIVDVSKLAANQTLPFNYEVIYTADKQKAKLRFYDDTDQKFIAAAPDLDITGDSKSQISFNIPSSYDFSNYDFVQVENNGQKLDGDKLSDVKYGNFDTDKAVDQVFVAHFTHKTIPINQEVTVTETIHYVYENGQKAHDDYQTHITFVESGSQDLVTGKKDVKWTPKNGKFNRVDSPVISGYTADKPFIDSISVDPTSGSIEKKVIYSPDGGSDTPDIPEEKPNDIPKPDTDEIPDKDKPLDDKINKPNTPKQTHSKILKPDETKHKVSKKKAQKSNSKPNSWSENRHPFGTKLNNSSRNSRPLGTKAGKRASQTIVPKSQIVRTNNSGNSEKLPQTGSDNNRLGLLGLAFASIAGLIGLFDDRKRKNKK